MKLSLCAPQKISLLLALVVAIVFIGCPQTVVKRIEELRPPPGYRPVYVDTTVEISADTLLVRIQQGREAFSSGGKGADSLTSVAEKQHQLSDSSTVISGDCTFALYPRQLDDSRYPHEIVFDVTVTDDRGRIVTGLAPPNYHLPQPWRTLWFSLSDSCKGQRTEVNSFTIEEVRSQRQERFAIAFVLDHSPSMGEVRVVLLRRAVAQVLRQFISGDAAAVIRFGGRSVVELPITADTAAFRRFNPDRAEMIGGTAIYDALAAAINELRKVPPQYRRVVVLFTDGEDNASKATLQQVVRQALDSAVTVYTIAYGWFEEEPLRLLAQGTHGQMYRIYSVREFPHVFARIYRALRSFYRVRYHPPECAGMHTVRLGFRWGQCATFTTGRYDRSVLSALDTVGTIVFLPIEFDYDRASLRPESLPLVERIADAMKAHPSLKIEVRGHTDDRGSEEYNLRLSQRRAEAVVEALVQMGIERSRLRAIGFGESRPLVPNTSDENRARNRRTEFVIIAN
ncbi:MAG: OmpA family protein [Bacteroidota bacterium]|nr:OmpA family protein [Candidatus Kapabacteria bacterium]MCS7302738.1 OmpA family protein [Candidatus Kapabacteria bacterium]MCX7937245.1 OmpA family protein [Chlorobiota bacterium]MDW8075742.1 OmpA family protein [Bacteroidota bacterium]